MNKKVSIPCFMVLFSVLVLMQGCKIEITVPEGGNVVSGSHAYDCGSGETCVIEVNDFYFDQIFDAHASEGWIFVGWKLGGRYLCQRSESVCRLSNKGLGQYESLSAIVESDETFFLEPEFVKRTPFDEALANVQDEGLRACLNNVSAPRRYAQQVRNVDCQPYVYPYLGVGSVQGIEAFSRIERLAFGGNSSLTDLQPLGKLSRLQNLELLLHTSYFNAAALGELTLLDYLSLSFFPGTSNPDLTEMGNLQSLRRLTLSAVSPLDLDGIGSLVNLSEFNVNLAPISDIGPLAGMTKLKSLNLRSKQISDIGPLAGMTKLETLELGGNQISDIGPLAGMTRLETLDLGSNQVSDISPLAGMTRLKLLYLSNNQITEIGSLAGMTRLEILSLASNQVSDISPLAESNNLETLNLAANQIDDIGALAEIQSIPRLYLQNNLIHDASPLRQHYPLTLDSSFGHEITYPFFSDGDLVFKTFFGAELDLSNNPVVSLDDALDGFRAGVILLIDVPLKCTEYPRLSEQYESRTIITDKARFEFGEAGIYRLPERCL